MERIMEISFKEAFTFMFKDEKFKSKYIIGSLFCLLFAISMGLYLGKTGEFFSFMSSDLYSQLISTSQSSEVPVEFLTFYAGMMLCSLFMFVGSFVMLFSIFEKCIYLLFTRLPSVSIFKVFHPLYF